MDNWFEESEREGITNPLKEDIFTWGTNREKTRAHMFLEKMYDRRLKTYSDKFFILKNKKQKIDPVIIESMNIYKEMVIDSYDFEICLSEIGKQGINVKDTKGRTLLHALCLFGTLRAVQLLVKYNVTINCFDNNGFGPLHFCAVSDRSSIAEYLMRVCRVSLDTPATGKNGRYPIHIAAMCGSMNMFKLLVGYQISSGGDVLTADNPTNLTRKDNNNGKHSRTPLWLATFYKHGSIAQLIIELMRGQDIVETSEPEMSFIFRIGTKLPTVARELMDSFIISHPERNSRLFYVEEGTLYNGSWGDSFDNLDQGIQLSYGAITNPGEASTAPLLKILSHDYMWNVVNVVKWRIYGGFSVMVYSISKWLYILLWTAIYVCDSTEFKDKGVDWAENIMYTLIISTLVVFGFLLLFDTIRGLGIKDCVNKFIIHEKRVIDQELYILKNAMMPVPWCMLKSEQSEINRLGNKYKISFITGVSLFEYFVDLFSFVMFGYYIYVFMKSKDGRLAAKGNEIRDYINSVLLICMYIMGLGTLRFVEYFAYLLEVLKQAVIDIAKWLTVFCVFYIPVVVVLWESIYNYEHVTAIAYNTTSNMTTDLMYVITETFRKTHANYEYNQGRDMADDKGDWKQIRISWWWYVTLFYWFILGAIILVNMLIALMSDSISKIKEKSKMICAYNTMIFQAELEAMMPSVMIRRMQSFITGAEQCEREQRKLVCELPPDDSGDSNQALVNNFFETDLAKHREDVLVLSKYSHDNYIDKAYLSQCYKFVSKAAYRKDD